MESLGEEVLEVKGMRTVLLNYCCNELNIFIIIAIHFYFFFCKGERVLLDHCNELCLDVISYSLFPH